MLQDAKYPDSVLFLEEKYFYIGRVGKKREGENELGHLPL